MPTFRFQKADTVENTVDELINRIAWLTSKLDSQNVKRLDTNETVIKSADGSTEIVGPILLQKDSNGTTRLQQGYDSGTNLFIYAMYNDSGVETIGLDSNGNAVYKGIVTIGTGNNVFKADGTNGIWLGHADFASAPFKVSLAGAATATNLTINGGSISVDTDISVGNNINIGDLTSLASSKYIYFYDNGPNSAFIEFLTTTGDIEVFSFNNATLHGLNKAYVIGYNAFQIESVYSSSTDNANITHVGSGHLNLTHSGSGDMVFESSGGGDIKINAASNQDVILSSFSYISSIAAGNQIATQSYVNGQGYITGTSGYTGSFTNGDGNTVTVVDGLITTVV